MSEIKPALTVQGWRDCMVVLDNDWGRGPDIMMWLALDDDGVLRLGNRDAEGLFEANAEPPTRHALAALCLHEQPFGFTWEDVDALREEADRGERADLEGNNAGYPAIDPDHARSLADRIAALLPPGRPAMTQITIEASREDVQRLSKAAAMLEMFGEVAEKSPGSWISLAAPKFTDQANELTALASRIEAALEGEGE